MIKFEIKRETLLQPLQFLSGVVEKKQTLQILSNVLLKLLPQQLCLTGTDHEIELLARVALDTTAIATGQTTVSARKLMDICKALPEEATLKVQIEQERLIIRSGRSRFALATLPADDFPTFEDGPGLKEFSLSQNDLKSLIDRSQFAMAQQDVRYYLNGMLFELSQHQIQMVATDGHRLAFNTRSLSPELGTNISIILPRKAIIELSRLLDVSEKAISLTVGDNFVRFTSDDFTFSSKLVDGRFPDFKKSLPKKVNFKASMDRDGLKQVLLRASVLLSAEKCRSIRLAFEQDLLKVSVNNPEQEQAEDELEINYQGNNFEIGFNASYLLDILNVLPPGNIIFNMVDENSSVLIESEHANTKGGIESLYVVMPMRI